VAEVQAISQFEKTYVDEMAALKVLRFLGWSHTSGNSASITLENRTKPARRGMDRVAVETRIDLANAAGTDAYFTVA
jgi:hypothetical protein